MKSIFLIAIMMLVVALSLSAQIIGITAGASFANVKVKADDLTGSPKTKTGITAGLFTKLPLSSDISFQPGLNFVQKGYIVKDDIGTETANLNYLELPLNFVYSKSVSNGLFIGAGPSIAYGLSGSDKLKYKDGGMPDQSDKVHFGSGADDDVKPFDFGANFIVGYQFKGGFLITGNYTLGLSKINNEDDSVESGSIKNNYFGVKLGYVFGKNK